MRDGQILICYDGSDDAKAALPTGASSYAD